MKIHGWKMKFLYHLHLFTTWFFTWSTRLFVEPNFNDQTNNKLFATHVIGITCSIRDSDSHTSWWLILGKETTVLIEGPREKMGILRKHGVETLAFYPTSKTNISTYDPWKLMVQVGYQWNFPSLKSFVPFHPQKLVVDHFSVEVGGLRQGILDPWP